MKAPIALLSILSVLVFNSCEESSPDSSNPPNLRNLSAAEMRIAVSGNDFAFKLFQKINTTGENNFISPLSVSMALGMVLNGASEATKQSILNTIDYGDLSSEEVNEGYRDLTELLLSMDKKITLGVANSVWYSDQLTVASPFKSTIENYYDGRVQALNFQDPNAKDIINNWVEDKTNDRIKNLIERISPGDVMYLVNAIYFKGDWTYKFTRTFEGPFYTPNEPAVNTTMMHSEGVAMQYLLNDEVELIDLPYGNEQFHFTILLPGYQRTMTELQESLSAASLESWLTKSSAVQRELEMPKFTFQWRDNLKSILEQMGMQTSGFPELFDDAKNLAISQVIHQTFIDVNQKGTEAAAATAIGIELTSMPAKITVNRPFIFLIREKHSNTILFIGSFKQPV